MVLGLFVRPKRLRVAMKSTGLEQDNRIFMQYTEMTVQYRTAAYHSQRHSQTQCMDSILEHMLTHWVCRMQDIWH